MKNHISVLFLLICCLLWNGNVQAQVMGDEEDGAVFIGGLSPFILDQGQIEINNQSYIVSFWNKINTTSRDGSLYSNIYRLTQFQNRSSIHYGFSESKTWDLGLDLTYTMVRWDDYARKTPFIIFNGDDINKSGLSLIGVKARFAPFENIPGFMVQGAFRFPIANGDELRRDLGANRVQLSLLSSYFQRIDYNNSYFFQAGWTVQPSSNNEAIGSFLPTSHAVSLGGYLISNIWEQRFFVIPGLTYSGTFQHSAKSSKILQRSHAVLLDIILQFQFSEVVSVNFQQSLPLLFESYIPLVEYDRRSFSASAVSFRVAF